MRRSIVGIAVAALAVSPVAFAVAPHTGTYKGTVAYHNTPLTFNGFNDPVTFTVAPSGTAVTGLSFGFMSCSGSGGRLTAGKNYWLGSLKKVPTATLSKTGSFSGNGKWTRSQASPKLTDTVTYTVKGHFDKAGDAATGTIAVVENLTGPAVTTPAVTTPCATFTFAAKHG